MKKNIYLSYLLFLPLWVLLSCGYPEPRGEEDNNQDARSWIGVSAQDIDREIRDYLGLKSRSGVLVNNVADNSPAAEGGLRKQDVILRFDGEKIRNVSDLTSVVNRKRPGEKVGVEIIRDEKQKRLTFRVGERPTEYADSHEQMPNHDIDWQHESSWGGVWLGIQMVQLNDDLAEYFNVGKEDGILILSVIADSPATGGPKGRGYIIQNRPQTDSRTTSSSSSIAGLHARGPGQG